ncbi:MAG: hypothetical protein ABSG53_31555 [Thermoguttaceae bacterium]
MTQFQLDRAVAMLPASVFPRSATWASASLILHTPNSIYCLVRKPSTGIGSIHVAQLICRSVPARIGNSHDTLPTALSHKENHH